MNYEQHVRALSDQHKAANRQLLAHLDAVQASGRASAEDRQKEARIQADIDELETEIRRLVDAEKLETRNAERLDGLVQAGAISGGRPGPSKWETEDRANATLRNFLSPDGPRQMRVPVGGAARGGIRNELLYDTGSAGSVIPRYMGSELYEVLESEIAMLRLPTTKIVTENGATFDYPVLSTHTIGTQVIAQGTAIGGTDPEMDKVSFGAFKYGALIKVSWETIEDSAVDISRVIMRDAGRALGRIIDTALTTGDGSGEPLGIMSSGAVGASGTVATGGTAVTPSYETLVDLQYSVNDSYRNSGNAGWLFRDSTAAELRKLRDGAGGTIGSPLWQHSLDAGMADTRQPSMLLGDPAHTDPNVAAIGSANLIAAYGDWNGFGVRLVHDVVLERSDDLDFDRDLVAFRAKWRVDSRLLDTTAINRLNSNVS